LEIVLENFFARSLTQKSGGKKLTRLEEKELRCFDCIRANETKHSAAEPQPSRKNGRDTKKRREAKSLVAKSCREKSEKCLLRLHTEFAQRAKTLRDSSTDEHGFYGKIQAKEWQPENVRGEDDNKEQQFTQLQNKKIQNKRTPQFSKGFVACILIV